MRIQISLLAILMIMGACSPKSNENKAEKIENVPESSLHPVSPGDSVDADSEHQEEANQSLANLLEYWKTSSGKVVYPDFYGGAHITESGQLCVYIKNNKEKDRKEIIRIAGTKNITFKTFDHTYSYLTELMDYLNNFVLTKKKSKVIENISTFSLLEKENRIEVGLLECNAEKIKEFKNNVLDSPALTFRKSGKMRLE